MADQGHVLTDKKLKELERKIAAEYRQANKDVAKKLEDYLLKTEAQRQVQEKLLNAGKITQKEYSDWCFRHTMMGKRWEEMRDVLAADYHHANEIALKMAKGEMPDIFALNGNYATFQLEHDGKIDTGFTLYNHDTAEYLLKEDRELMPGPSTRKAKEIAANKDMQWNKQKIQSAVLQGVLQGESPYDVASRLQSVGQMNYNASVRYARTMTTNAQNAGRYEAYRRATNLGVDLVIEWQATLDGRTRHEHRMMHGQRRNVDEPFEVSGIKIMWPGNDKCGSSTVPQQLIWNCRCTLLSWVKGFEGDTVKKSPKMGDMTFEEWQNEKDPKKQTAQKKQTATSRIKQGELPPDPVEYANFQEYRAAKNAYHGDREYYSEGDTVFRGPISYGEGEYQNVKEFSATIQQLYEDYPLPNGARLDIGDYDEIDRYLTPRQVSRKDDDAAAQCWHNPNTGNYCIGYRPNTSYQSYADSLEERDRLISQGKVLSDVTGGSAQGVAIHEYGHAMSDYITNAMIYDDENAVAYWNWYKTLSKEEITNGLSAYAATNRFEFEAECFAELMTPNPRPLALQYRDYLYKCMEANYNETGKGEPAIKAMQNLIKRRNVSDIPTYFLPKDEYAHIMRDLGTWVDQEDCPIGTMQFFTTFYDDDSYTYAFERIGKSEFRIVGKTVAKRRQT